MRLRFRYCIVTLYCRHYFLLYLYNYVFVPVQAVSKIRILSEHLANQIAAGEVVERPASVVKELVENSLDAGATMVAVQVEGSGTRLIRVVDNGEGMDGDDVLLSLERHATSKLREESALEAITTLGFRGEALPSIGSVPRLTASCQGRPARRPEPGPKYGMAPCTRCTRPAVAQGTMVEVRSLFGNVPARKKFLKSARTELYHIEEVLRNQSLAHVGTAFYPAGGEPHGPRSAGTGQPGRPGPGYVSGPGHLVDPAAPSSETDDGVGLRGFLLQPDAAPQEQSAAHPGQSAGRCRTG